MEPEVVDCPREPSRGVVISVGNSSGAGGSGAFE